MIVDASWCSNSVDIGAEEDKVNDDVDDFEKDTVFPG